MKLSGLVASALLLLQFSSGLLGEVITVALIQSEAEYSSGEMTGVEAAAELAVQVVNEQEGKGALLLPEHTLEVDTIRIDCSALDIIQKLLQFQECASPNSSFCGTVIITGGCPLQSEIVAMLSQRLDVIQLNYLPLRPSLLEDHPSPNYFSLMPTIDQLLTAQLALLASFNITQITVLLEDEPTCREGWAVGRNQSAELFGAEPTFRVLSITDEYNTSQTVKSLRSQSFPRVVLVCAHEKLQRIIACEAAGTGSVYPDFVWIIPDLTFSSQRTQDGALCTANQTRRFLDRVVVVSPAYLRSSRAAMENGFVIDGVPELLSLPERLVFDSVLAAALSINRSLEDLRVVGGGREEAVRSLQKTLSNISFTGASGTVEFGHVSGQRENKGAHAVVYQLLPNGSLNQLPISIITGLDGGIPTVEHTISDLGQVFANGFPVAPVQPPVWDFEVTIINLAVYFTMVALVAMGIGYAVFCIVFTVCCRNEPEMKLTSPKLNIPLAIGSILWHVSIPIGWTPWPMELEFLSVRCEAQKWLLSFGATLLFMPLLLKTWRIYYIFHNPLKRKVALKDWKLLLALGVTLALDAVCLTVTTAVSRWRLTAVVVEDDDGGNSIVCGTAEAFLVNNVLFVVFKATECIIGLVLAFQTRKIKLKGLRESSQVTLASYIFAFTLVVFVVAQYLTTRQNTIYIVQLLVVGTLLLVMPVLILTVIFIPKFCHLIRRKVKHEDGEVDNEIHFDSIAGIDQLRKETLAAMQSEIDQLKGQLNDCRHARNSTYRRGGRTVTTDIHRSGAEQEQSTDITTVDFT